MDPLHSHNAGEWPPCNTVPSEPLFSCLTTAQNWTKILKKKKKKYLKGITRKKKKNKELQASPVLEAPECEFVF